MDTITSKGTPGPNGTVIRGARVVTMDRDRTVGNRDLHIGTDGRIRSVLEPGTPIDGAAEFDASGLIIVPGLVQAHVHLCQTLFRGLSEARPLLRWLRERIWPLEGAHDPETLRASANLGIAELLLGGTTSVLDMGTVHHTDALFQSAKETGIRYTGGKALMDTGEDVPASLAETTSHALAQSDRLADRWHGDAGGRLRYAYCPRFVLSCTPEALRGVAERSRRNGMVIHTHASEQPDEAAIVRAAYGQPNIATLRSMGIQGPGTVLAHGVWPEAEEITMMATDGTHVVHCPSSNMKLGSGVIPLRAYRDSGVNVALGADGAACSNHLDAWQELRLAGLLASMASGPGVVDATAIFELATIAGARALGLSDRIGSIEAGKAADLVAITSDAPVASGGGSIYTRLVYGTRATDVRHVWVDGHQVVRDGALTTLDLKDTMASADAARHQVAARLGIDLDAD
ncbi:MAG TPA: N-ethylammeline chlorohydrolase [Chloroflexi bacterium]|nr:N-ethylammeline chlorohydrolase [Chloroflexota bacterium]